MSDKTPSNREFQSWLATWLPPEVLTKPQEPSQSTDIPTYVYVVEFSTGEEGNVSVGDVYTLEELAIQHATLQAQHVIQQSYPGEDVYSSVDTTDSGEPVILLIDPNGGQELPESWTIRKRLVKS